MRDAFVKELTRQARQDPSIVLIVGDLGYGVVNDFADSLPEQFVNAGVAEQSMIGIAAGMAAAGRRAFVYSIANFPTLRALEQIRNDVCYHGRDVTVVSVGAGVAYGGHGYTHHAIEDISIMRALPRMRVISPADPTEAHAAVGDSIRHSGPTYVRLGKNGEVPLRASAEVVDLGSPTPLTSGGDLVIVATGAIVGECLQAADLLQADGIRCAVLSCPTIKPMDTAWLEGLPAAIPVLTVEEHTRTGGFGSAVLEAANDLGFQANLTRLGLDDREIGLIGSQTYLRAAHGLDSYGIANSARRVLNR